MTKARSVPLGGEHPLTVALRIRPLTEEELFSGAALIAHKVADDNMVCLQDPDEDPDDILRANRTREKRYMFDVALDAGESQEDVYEKTAKFIIPNVINGYNCTVFAYGATGAGKTYTMLGTEENPGIMARTLNDLFEEMSKTEEEMEYIVTMSYLEIYNELIRDLLNPSSGFLDLREDAKGGVQVPGLTEIEARSTHEVLRTLHKGNRARTQEPTAANKTSSRSHAVLSVNIKQRDRTRDVRQTVRMGKLYMIDLAGSERAAQTQNTGKRMVEGAHINRSLLALGNCINALASHNGGARYVNYRDSKLTRLLKDSLGGNTRTIMIAHISPASLHFEESRNTLVYADRAKSIKTKVRRNVMDVNYHIAQYTQIITELRGEISRLKSKIDEQQMLLSKTTPKDGSSEAKRRFLETERLKELLLKNFKEQMELRRCIMEVDSNLMEISLDSQKHMRSIAEWEQDKAKPKNGSLDGNEDGSKPQEEVSVIDEGEPDDIRGAKEELKVLFSHQNELEHKRMRLERDLQNVKVKASEVEDVLPRKISSQEEQEILSLLCRVHELEIENTELQSTVLLRNHEIRKKDMMLTQNDHRHTLCEEIIVQQRQLLDEHAIEYPKDLEALFSMYRQEVEESINASRHNLVPSSFRRTRIDLGRKNSLQSDHLMTPRESPEKVFSSRGTVPKAQLMVPSSPTDDGRESPLSLYSTKELANIVVKAGQRKMSQQIIVESHNSDDSTSVQTKGIAAIADKKRRRTRDDDYLSPSRLARHDRHYPLPHQILRSDDDLATKSDRASPPPLVDRRRPPLRKGDSLEKTGQPRKPAGNRPKLAKINGTKNSERRANRGMPMEKPQLYRKQDMTPASPDSYHHPAKKNDHSRMQPYPPPPLVGAKAPTSTAFDSSSATPPVDIFAKMKHSKRQPTIPNYLKHDITLSGIPIRK